MSEYERKTRGSGLGISPSGRRKAIKWLGLSMTIAVSGCNPRTGKVRRGTILALVMYSYLDRPIHNIFFNRTALGVANKYGGTGIITAVQIPFGIQTLKWRLGGPEGMPRNGQLAEIKNKMILTPEMVPKYARYIGLHLYPDDTAEITFAELIPERTPRGEQLIANRSD